MNNEYEHGAAAHLVSQHELAIIYFLYAVFKIHTVHSVRKAIDTEVEPWGLFLALVGFVNGRVFHVLLVPVCGPVVVVVEVLAVAAVRIGPFHLQVMSVVFCLFSQTRKLP